MQALKGFGMQAQELPTDAVSGITWRRGTAWSMADQGHPANADLQQSTRLHHAGRQQTRPATLAQRHDVAIIEDDIYGDQAYKYPRPRTIKSFDEDGRVLLCSSFSKTLAPGLRIGWIPRPLPAAGAHMKYMSTGMSAQLPQLALAEFIAGGHYEPHLRRMRSQYARGREPMTGWVSQYFPAGTRASQLHALGRAGAGSDTGLNSWSAPCPRTRQTPPPPRN